MAHAQTTSRGRTLYPPREPAIYWFAPEVNRWAKYELPPGSRRFDDARGPLPALRRAGR